MSAYMLLIFRRFVLVCRTLLGNLDGSFLTNQYIALQFLTHAVLLIMINYNSSYSHKLAQYHTQKNLA